MSYIETKKRNKAQISERRADKVRNRLNIEFKDSFQVVPVNRHELLEKVHNIRYEVFSKELCYFDEKKFPNHYEVDEHDQVSQQCLIKSKSKDLYVGCVRLVSGMRNGQRNRLPFESYYGDNHFCSEVVDIKELNPSSYGEISRAAVISTDRSSSLVGFGLYLASAVMGLNSGYERVFCMMEPRLARRLRIYGINFTQIAPIVEKKDKPAAYKRAAYQITRKELLEGVPSEVSTLIEEIRNSLESPMYGSLLRKEQLPMTNKTRIDNYEYV